MKKTCPKKREPKGGCMMCKWYDEYYMKCGFKRGER